jgi:hypothetical protein
MPGRAARRRLFPSLSLLAIAVAAACTPAASAAPLSIQDSLVGPVAPDSPCTVEPKRPENNNAAPYDPLVPTYWPTGANLAGLEDVQRTANAATFSDLCVAFRLDSDYTVSRVGNYGGPFAGPTNSATNPATGDDLKDLEVTLPAGYGARLKDAGTCTDADFGLTPSRYITWTPGGARPGLKSSPTDPQNGYDAQPVWDTKATCPETALVGEIAVRASNTFSLLQQVLLGGGQYTTDYDGVTETIGGAVWQLAPGPNELGRLGAQVQLPGVTSPLKFAVSLRLATDGSGRVLSVVERAPRIAFMELDSSARLTYVESIALRLWGSAAEHPVRNAPDVDGQNVRWVQPSADFMETPTRCDTTANGSIVGSTYGGTNGNALTSTYVPTPLSATLAGTSFTGCDLAPFQPSVEVTTSEQRPGVPTGVDVRVRIDQRPLAGRLPAHLRDAVVTLPRGLELGAQAGSGPDGLTFCAPAAFARDDVTVASACPDATRAAEVRIETPLLARAFTGRAWLGQPSGGRDLPDLYLEATLEGSSGAGAPRIKLVGSVEAAADGALTTTFRNAPELRFGELRLSFPSGPHALFTTPPRCGEFTSTSALTPWSRSTPTEVTTKLTIDEGCDAAFAPTASLEPLDPRAGRKGAVRITIARPSSAPWLQRIAMHLPPGFLADLGNAAECGAAAASAGSCPEASRIGTLKVLAGAGEQPLPLTGAMYLAERRDGDVAGAVLVTRAKVGDLDLGDVVVPGRIQLRPTDAGLDFIAEVPVRHKGIALQLQQVEVTLDRDEFALNPSACGPLAFSVDITSDAGVSASPSGSVSYTGCGALPFRPSLKATLTGDNRPGGFPGMFVRLESPEGDVGMRSASVTLPAGVAAALPNVKNPCPREEFDAQRCAPTSRVGSAVARVSITPDAIRGDIFLIKVPGKTLPGLGLSFTGRYAQRVTSIVEVNKDGRLVTNFPAIPDLPLRSLEIQVDSGPRSPLQLPEGACAGGSNWDGTFTGQGGQTASAKTGLQCAASANARLSDKRGLTVRLFDFGGRKLQSLKATLPAGWRFDRAAAKKKGALWVRMTGATPKVRLTARSLTALSGSTTASDVRVKISGKIVRPTSRAARRAKSVSIPLRLAFTDGTVQTQTLTVATR